MDKMHGLRQVKAFLGQLVDKQKYEIMRRYCLLGTSDVQKMVGKVGFLDEEGLYYPVRKMIWDKEEHDGDFITHDAWARLYFEYVLNENTYLHKNYFGALLRDYHFVAIVEYGTDELIIVNYAGDNRLNEAQQKSFDMLLRENGKVKGSKKS